MKPHYKSSDSREETPFHIRTQKAKGAPKGQTRGRRIRVKLSGKKDPAPVSSGKFPFGNTEGASPLKLEGESLRSITEAHEAESCAFFCSNRQGAELFMETPRELPGRKEPSVELDQLAHTVIGAAIGVHRALGPGYIESVYEEAICVEMDFQSVPYQRQYKIAVQYRGHSVGEGRLDLLVAKMLPVELKAVEMLAPHPSSAVVILSKNDGTPTRLANQLQLTCIETGYQACNSLHVNLMLFSWRHKSNLGALCALAVNSKGD